MIYVVYYQRFFGLLRPAEIERRFLNFSHRRLKTVAATSPEDVYRQMQAEVWSPNGEARRLIRRLQLGHTSMSVGDVLQSATGEMWACELSGWRPVPVDETDASGTQWLATETDLTGAIQRLKISDEKDCLPAAATTVESLGWTAFNDLVSLAQLIEQRLGWEVCIDLGNEFYQTAIHSYVGYVPAGSWHNAIISVFAPSTEAARARIEMELRKPGRQHYHQLWVEAGRLVKLKEEQNDGPPGS
jgi:hypothetical protein